MFDKAGFFNDLNRIQGAVTKVVPVSLAQQVADKAKEIVPVDTGALRDSIHVSVAEDAAMVVADTPYAAIIESRTGFLRVAAASVTEEAVVKDINHAISN
jgi:phage gpG-like protein